jgi:hypothetical protein
MAAGAGPANPIIGWAAYQVGAGVLCFSDGGRAEAPLPGRAGEGPCKVVRLLSSG